jgi:hypothetical protein
MVESDGGVKRGGALEEAYERARDDPALDAFVASWRESPELSTWLNGAAIDVKALFRVGVSAERLGATLPLTPDRAASLRWHREARSRWESMAREHPCVLVHDLAKFAGPKEGSVARFVLVQTRRADFADEAHRALFLHFFVRVRELAGLGNLRVEAIRAFPDWIDDPEILSCIADREGSTCIEPILLAAEASAEGRGALTDALMLLSGLEPEADETQERLLGRLRGWFDEHRMHLMLDRSALHPAPFEEAYFYPAES